MFSTGTEVTLDEVLTNREARAQFIATHFNADARNVVLSVSCNIPGGIKTNASIEAFFDKKVAELKSVFLHENLKIKEFHQWNKNTGPEAFFVFTEDPLKIKKLTIRCEQQSSGRLLDLDVTYFDEQQQEQKTVKRTELGFSPRRCLICDEDAKVCGSRRLHSVEELQTAVAQIILEEQRKGR